MLLRDGSRTDDQRLGRIRSFGTEHLEKYPLTAATMPAQARPVVAGVNWYSTGDVPRLKRIYGRERYVIGQGSAGSLRGGHAVCLRPWHIEDTPGWWRYYDQGEEGRCVEFAWLRALTLMNRKRYDITSRWHYWEAQRRDYWPGGEYPGAVPQYSGTSVDAGAQVMRNEGAIPSRWLGLPISPASAPGRVRTEEGIGTYRWAQDWNDVRTVLEVPDWMPGVPLLNSWGRAYPREVILLDELGERMLAEDGEFAVATDK